VTGANVTTPVLSPASPVNYTVAMVTGTLNVGFAYAQQDCFDWPIAGALPPTFPAIEKGLPIPLKCTLRNAQGAIVTTATGEVCVYDIGPNGTSEPVEVFYKANAFEFFAGSYWYVLNTLPSGFTGNRYYKVMSRWDDGSTTTGYFYLRN
jgi:hypothetical protein